MQLLALQQLAAEVEALLLSCDAAGDAVGDAVGKAGGAVPISARSGRSSGGPRSGALYAESLAARVRSANGALRAAQRALDRIDAERVGEEECAQQ